ncbi:MAG: DUF302 domain-containing protein [Gammaproteobacteria bacterium]|nr:DUF302 domain-containing protein [Gammaproteobacteria bacterium]
MFKSLFALIGFVTVLALGAGAVKFAPYYEQMKGFDEGALATYTEMVTKLLETGNSAEATVWKVKVESELSAADVEQSMKMVANEHNMSNVGELPLYKDVEMKTGKPYRFAKIYMFCNSLTAAKMMDYSDSFSAYLPCRISLIEDKTGQLWLYSLNMDMMIYGGTPLPADLKEEAMRVKMVIQDIMGRGAAGDF